MSIAKQIKTARENMGISQRELARRSEIPHKTINRIENEVDMPKITTLSKIAEALNMSVEVKLIDKN